MRPAWRQVPEEGGRRLSASRRQIGGVPGVRGLYLTYGPMVYRRCLSILRNEEEALDAMHEVFVKQMSTPAHPAVRYASAFSRIRSRVAGAARASARRSGSRSSTRAPPAPSRGRKAESGGPPFIVDTANVAERYAPQRHQSAPVFEGLAATPYFPVEDALLKLAENKQARSVGDQALDRGLAIGVLQQQLRPSLSSVFR